ncbi:unnamed protein product, partial [Ectocarpus sp. 4 AP-2014]
PRKTIYNLRAINQSILHTTRKDTQFLRTWYANEQEKSSLTSKRMHACICTCPGRNKHDNLPRTSAFKNFVFIFPACFFGRVHVLVLPSFFSPHDHLPFLPTSSLVPQKK